MENLEKMLLLVGLEVEVAATHQGELVVLVLLTKGTMAVVFLGLQLPTLDLEVVVKGQQAQMLVAKVLELVVTEALLGMHQAEAVGAEDVVVH